MVKHGIYPNKVVEKKSAPEVAECAIPFVIGAAPLQSAENPAIVGAPVLCENFEEAKEKLGYSDNWVSFPLCEFMYSQFMLYGAGPVIFCNLLDPAIATSPVEAADHDVADHRILLPIEAINDDNLLVKEQGGSGASYVKDTDYAVYYSGENLVIELLEDGSAYDSSQLNVAYNKVDVSTVDAEAVAAGMEAIECCMTTVGIVPDLICAPGYSHDKTVAAVMAVKANGVNGMFHGKAVVDIDASASGATTYTAAIEKKAELLMNDPNEIVCWPMVPLEGRIYHRSTQICGLMAKVDQATGCPYDGPSNQDMQCDGMCLADGTEVLLTVTQANELNGAGILTGLNAFGTWVAWGNYTAVYPEETGAETVFIPVSRMFDWVGNTLVKTCWKKLDRPLRLSMLERVLDTVNVWINGLVGSGYILGGRVEMKDSENPAGDLKNGIARFHIYLTPPSPGQEFDFILEYDEAYVQTAFQG